MEQLNKLRSKVLPALALGVGALTLGACANYSGEGNEFVVEGKMVDVGEKSIKATVYGIKEVNGDAKDWFELDSDHRFHDNCNCHGAWTGNKTYGHEFTIEGTETDLTDIREDSCVELSGKIRDHKVGKNSFKRPVYDEARVIPCNI